MTGPLSSGEPAGRRGRGGASRVAASLDTQERITAAFTDLVSRHGYARLTVEPVLERAGVSRATFYQYFSSVEECFTHSYREHGERLVREVAGARARDGRELAILEVLVRTAQGRPEVAALLFRESLAAGSAGLRARDRLIASLQRAARAAVPVSVLPSAVVIGAAMRLLVMRDGDDGLLATAHEDLRCWLSCYRDDHERHWWRESLGWSPAGPGAIAQPSVRMRHAPVERVLRGSAGAVKHWGYRATTVTHIVQLARVSRRTFYNAYADKAAAVAAAYEYGFRETMAAFAPAFFSAEEWPDRVWEGALALTRYLSREPALAHLGAVECYALGPHFSRKITDVLNAFTMFLEQGNGYRPAGTRLPEQCQTPVAASIAELAMLTARSLPSHELRRAHPLAVYIALAPFLGAHWAARYVTRKLAESSATVSTSACTPCSAG